MSKRAIILAGGKGTRLRPYTVVLPKPLMPIGDYPILEVIIRQLTYFGFDHITMAVNHQADIIKAYFGNGEKLNVKIDYSLETIPLSTMGPLRLIDDLPENFLVMNGDILTDIDYGLFHDNHCKDKNIFTISSSQRENVSEYGVLGVDTNSNLIEFKEKPREQFLVSMGIYMASKRILEFIPPNKAYGFDHLVLDLIKVQQFPKVKTHSGYWLDIGRSADYEKAIEEFESKKSSFLK